MSRLKTFASIVDMPLRSTTQAQKPQYPPAFPPTPILPSSINYAPSVTPNVMDTSAPDAQQVCPGYKASNVRETDSGLTADLTLAGPACNVYVLYLTP